MSAAFEKALLESGIQDRECEAARHVALRIINLAKREQKLREGAVEWYRRQAVPA